jgi:hypothetical protein
VRWIHGKHADASTTSAVISCVRKTRGIPVLTLVAAMNSRATNED